jgi:hypothetical protein
MSLLSLLAWTESDQHDREREQPLPSRSLVSHIGIFHTIEKVFGDLVPIWPVEESAHMPRAGYSVSTANRP